MEERNVYQDISRRTDGDVYIGVVGPVRTGKSTFIKRFMDLIVLPNIRDESVYRRTVDELPQSSAGKTIMTTEPKFIPEESADVDLGGNVTFKVRMIDCVGYIVDSALGHSEEDAPRMVKTPWSEDEMPFEQAAELGTEKVITDHSSIGLVITTDGSFNESYCTWCYTDGDYVYKSKDTLLDFLLSHSPNPGNLSDEERRSQYDSYLSELDHWK